MKISGFDALRRLYNRCAAYPLRKINKHNNQVVIILHHISN